MTLLSHSQGPNARVPTGAAPIALSKLSLATVRQVERKKNIAQNRCPRPLRSQHWPVIFGHPEVEQMRHSGRYTALSESALVRHPNSRAPLNVPLAVYLANRGSGRSSLFMDIAVFGLPGLGWTLAGTSAGWSTCFRSARQ